MEVVYRPFIKSIPENFPDLNISVDEAKAIVQAQDLRVAVVFTLDIDSLIKNVSSWDNSELPSVKYFNAPRKSGLRLQLDVPLGRDLVVCYYRCETGRILGSWRPYYEKWVENNTSLQTP